MPFENTFAVFRNILKRKSYNYVCAIDFGTSGTGFCYATPHKGMIDAKRDIIRNPDWLGNQQGRGKTNTSIILDEKENSCLKFGSDAKNSAADYAMNQKGRYFELFKMQLYEHIPNTPFVVKDSADREIDALIVFRESLAHIQKVFFEHLAKKNLSCSKTDVLWVLTIPAIWEDSAKSLMRAAAVAAGLENEDGQLILALEPEVASLWCVASGVLSLEQGDVYMVVDCGGGTVDIAVHKVERVDTRHPKVKEVAPATGGDWGSTTIDRRVFGMLREIFGDNRYERLKKDDIGLPMLQDNIERAKCAFNGEINPVIQLPDSLLQPTIQDKDTAYQAISNFNRRRQTKLLLKGSNLLIPAAVFSEFVDATVRSILNHVEMQLEAYPAIKYVVMAGNFSNCIPLQKQMEAALSLTEAKLIIPDDPGDAIMKGAVIYGVDTSSVSTRCARKTYGVKVDVPFIEGVHPRDRICIRDGFAFCKDVFDIFVKKYEEIPSGHIVEREYSRVSPNQTMAVLEILVSDDDEPPKFTDDYAVEVIGSQTIQIPIDGTGTITAGMLFGDTELRCRSVNDNGEEAVTKLLLL